MRKLLNLWIRFILTWRKCLLILDKSRNPVDRIFGDLSAGRTAKIGLVEHSRPYVNHARENKGYPRRI